MEGSTKTILKKVFLNVSVVFLAVMYTANIIAIENASIINTTLGIKTYKIVTASHDGDNEYTRYYKSDFTRIADLKKAGYKKAQEVLAEGAVLLKNENNTLPLKTKKVSLFGATSVNPVYGGTGSGSVSAKDAPSYLDAMKQSGFQVNETLYNWYKGSGYGRVKGSGMWSVMSIGEASWSTINNACGSSYGNGEAAIFIIGRVGGEGSDLKSTDQADGLNGDYLTLNTEERSILEGLKALKDAGKISGITILINSANPVSSAFIDDKKYGIDAVLWVGSVGQTGLYAVADILSGAVNPSGSLPDTWWTDDMLDPAMANFGVYKYNNAESYNFGDSKDSMGGDIKASFINYVVYQEGIYVGYKYTETRYEDVVLGKENAGEFNYKDTVVYPFGYGLSYTQFKHSNLQVEKTGTGQDTTYTAHVTVTNTGSVAGKETVQLYVQKPYTDYDIQNQIEKASVELVGYAKTGELAAGASETVSIEVPEYYFTSYDAYGTGVYILDKGTYYLTAAENCHAAINNILAAKGITTANGMTADGNANMVQSYKYSFDSETYSTAMGTGNKVTSLFADADINRYEGKGDNSVTYFSRNNWKGTINSWKDTNGDGKNDNYVKLKMTDQIAKDVVLDKSDIPEDKKGLEFPTMGSTDTAFQLIDLRVDSNGKEIAYNDPIWEDFLDQLTYEQMSKICAVGLHVTAGIEEVGKPETRDENGPVGVTVSYSIAQNGYATVTNDPDKDLKGTSYPCNGIIAATFNDKLVNEVGELIGEDGMWAGISGIYGTGLNIHRTPYSGRVFEYYSEDSILSGLIVASETAGIQSKGIYVYNKHFVLNDQEDQRAGLGTWVNEQAMRETYLRAFELPIVYADAKCIMTAFNRLGAIWSGASKELNTDWLRGEAGLSGFVITDMYSGSYMSKPHEVLAGNDIPDNYPGRAMGSNASVSADAQVAEFTAYGPKGSTPSATLAWAMRESTHRVMYTVVHSRGMDGISADSTIIPVTPWWQTALTVGQIAFAVLTVLAGFFMVLDIVKRRKTAAKVDVTKQALFN